MTEAGTHSSMNEPEATAMGGPAEGAQGASEPGGPIKRLYHWVLYRSLPGLAQWGKP